MANVIAQFRGELVPQTFLDQLADAVKAGAAVEGSTVTSPNADLVDWLQWRGASTVQSAYEAGRELGRKEDLGALPGSDVAAGLVNAKQAVGALIVFLSQGPNAVLSQHDAESLQRILDGEP